MRLAEMRRIFIAIAAAAVLMPAGVRAEVEWDAARMVPCKDFLHKESGKLSSGPEFWDAVGDRADLIGIDQGCRSLLVWAECRDHPRMTVGQALASIYYKIEFGRRQSPNGSHAIAGPAMERRRPAKPPARPRLGDAL
jgi:hypothetical protein